MKKTLFILSMLVFLGLSKNTQAQVSHVVISQVYGGGGNATAVYKNDFIELFNPTSSPVPLAGWSVQYMSAAGTSAGTNITALTGTIQPGAYFLIQEGAGAGTGVNLPTADVTTGVIAMSATVGKVFLCNSIAQLATSCASATIVDYVGFGSTASCHEGAAATPAPTNSTSVSRASGGCIDTDQNGADFTAGVPIARNSSYAVSITAASNNTVIGNAFSYTITASTAPKPTSFSLTAGSLPAGLSLDGVTGIISGTVTDVAGTYTAQITANNNCAKTAAATFSFNVNTLTNNTVSFTGGANQTFTVCQDVAATSINSLVQINDADFGQTETWSVTAAPSNGTVVIGATALSNGGNVTPTGFTYMPNALFNGTDVFTVQVDDGSGTPASTTVTVTVNAAPTVTASTTNSVVCAGDMITLTAGGTATTYTWTNAVVDGTPFAPTTNTYSVTGTDGNGCTAMASIAITVNNLPAVQANTTATVVCAGDMITLTGGSALTYTWSGTVVDGAAFAPATGTDTYTVTGTDANNCVNTATVTVTVNSLPGVQANTTATVICAGDMITLTGGSALTYTWSGSVVDGTAFAPATGTDTYTVTGTDANNCVNTATVAVTVNGLPSVQANATATVICAGDMTTLTATGTATTYTWSGSVVDGTAFAPATGTDTYTVTGTDGNNCMNSASVTVTVNSLPGVQANTTATVVCAGDMITLTGGSALTYTWSGTVVDGTPFAPATGTDTYTVTGTDANNCVNTASVTVTVNSLPGVQANTTATVVCAGDMITLTGGGATTYTWSGSVVDGAAFAPATGTDTYTVTGTDANNCVNTASVAVTVNSLPATPNVTQAGDVLSSDVTGISYQWYFNSTPISTNGTSATYTVISTGVYQVEVFNAQNCSSISADYTVSTTGIANVAFSKNVHIYPNPASSFITVEADAKISLIQLYDISGKVIISETPSTNAHTIQLNGVEPGVYFLKTEKNNQTSVQKIIVR